MVSLHNEFVSLREFKHFGGFFFQRDLWILQSCYLEDKVSIFFIFVYVIRVQITLLLLFKHVLFSVGLYSYALSLFNLLQCLTL